MTQLSIRNGQLYQGSQVIRPECGNAEHIACLKKYDKARSRALDGDIDIDVEACVKYTIRWECICGQHLSIHGNTGTAPLFDALEEAIADDMPQTEICRICGCAYRVEKDAEDGGVRIYLKD